MPMWPTPYVSFPGTAREALEFYRDVFGGDLTLHTRADFGSADEPLEAIAHGILSGPVQLFGADADGPAPSPHCEGIMFSLLGASDAETLTGWFARLAEGGRVVDDLRSRPWGASDGQVVDKYGLHWLIGFEH
ncbi:VOC family protein [Sinomonas sp. ASV486]|uniref:VOC family protein n=1 Tax=Sinomonas sp. ASV486 TaxID=3051170 RepID=UPI0027DBF3C3|nr:VOC family protein [Sinomonas sp. ASV486]MDQ4491406.1 VOC family protein [Sinomonas sp. ASV486]